MFGRKSKAEKYGEFVYAYTLAMATGYGLRTIENAREMERMRLYGLKQGFLWSDGMGDQRFEDGRKVIDCVGELADKAKAADVDLHSQTPDTSFLY